MSNINNPKYIRMKEGETILEINQKQHSDYGLKFNYNSIVTALNQPEQKIMFEQLSIEDFKLVKFFQKNNLELNELNVKIYDVIENFTYMGYWNEKQVVEKTSYYGISNNKKNIQLISSYINKNDENKKTFINNPLNIYYLTLSVFFGLLKKEDFKLNNFQINFLNHTLNYNGSFNNMYLMNILDIIEEIYKTENFKLEGTLNSKQKSFNYYFTYFTKSIFFEENYTDYDLKLKNKTISEFIEEMEFIFNYNSIFSSNEENYIYIGKRLKEILKNKKALNSEEIQEFSQWYKNNYIFPPKNFTKIESKISEIQSRGKLKGKLLNFLSI